jgi:hypothetical protein
VIPRAYDGTPWAGGSSAGAGQEAEADPDLRRRIYDTTRMATEMAGIDYGSDLSDEDRAALIEYLKTL